MTPNRGEGHRRFTALVLAGSRGPGDPVASAAGVGHKCLVRAGGVPMLARVVGALTDSDAVGPIVIVVDPGLAEDERALATLDGLEGCRILVGGSTPATSVLAAIETLDDAFPLLITTADHPLLTPAMVDLFCAAATAGDADIAAGLTPASAIAAAYPEARRTYLRFRDGRFSGANTFAVLRPDGLRAVAFWRRVEMDRKRPWRLARAFGVWSLLAYLTGRLTLAGAMARASRIVGVRARAVEIPIAEAAIDVDKPADLALVERILAQKGQDRVHAGPSV